MDLFPLGLQNANGNGFGSAAVGTSLFVLAN
jgi:hypothetical protein